MNEGAEGKGHGIALPILIVFGLIVTGAFLWALFNDPLSNPEESPQDAPAPATAATSTTSNAPEPSSTRFSSSAPQTRSSTAQPNATVGAVPACDPAEIPPEVDDTIADIQAGGPFPYPENDGKRFGNYEGFLPKESKNYYREYTVDTPGVRHRGERRIVTGGDPATDPRVWYYTADHYESFCEVIDID
ncbi:ribonuclease domain-containing protein [Corynebacterium aquatimens]|uniref:ribonuclease domain-containing protein n=1 Tax=Corynebacterium aquatimens TaxID=1190508 RepID=UPI0025B2D19B|nr:ribonuclease domain-containing protein [Corynebacterium aquatimens]